MGQGMDEQAPEPVVVDLKTLWEGFGRGDAAARDRLLALHYDEMRRVARKVLRDEGAKLHIQPTELANEAAIRLLHLDRIAWKERTHFLAVSARVMRQILIDEVRRFRAQKRQAPPVVTRWVDHAADERARAPLDLEAFDDSLTRLAAVDPDKARLVEMRFFAGLTIEEIAQMDGVSESTVKRQWRTARAWLLKDLGQDSDEA
jgi:RNA polymerase sigma factor (TIGR02999 family)